jgi:hypothetical protein
MSNVTDALATTVSVITAMGALGTAAFGLVDATKVFGGGVSNIGFGAVDHALLPFRAALDSATPNWRATLRANWINGVGKEDQKTAAKTLIRLGISSTNVEALATAGHVDRAELREALEAIGTGAPLSVADAQVFGRFNAVIDAVMDAGYELGEQRYRNACKFVAGVIAIGLALWAGYLVNDLPLTAALHGPGSYVGSRLFWSALFAGAISVPVAPIAKNLASSLQDAATAVTAAKL